MWLAFLGSVLTAQAAEITLAPDAPLIAHVGSTQLDALAACGVEDGALTAEILVQFGKVVAVAETSSDLPPGPGRTCALGALFGWELSPDLVGDFAVPLTFSEPPPEFDPAVAPLVERAVRLQSPQIRYCYEQALGRSPNLSGTLEIAASIEGGVVAGVAFPADTIGDAELRECVSRRMGRWQFPAEATGQIVLPLTMAPGS